MEKQLGYIEGETARGWKTDRVRKTKRKREKSACEREFERD